jgi:hypothetical protein
MTRNPLIDKEFSQTGVPEGNCATPLITQRSQVQILPPLQRRRPRIPGPSVIWQDHRDGADSGECPSNVRHAHAGSGQRGPAAATRRSARRRPNDGAASDPPDAACVPRRLRRSRTVTCGVRAGRPRTVWRTAVEIKTTQMDCYCALQLPKTLQMLAGANSGGRPRDGVDLTRVTGYAVAIIDLFHDPETSGATRATASPHWSLLRCGRGGV